LFYFSFISHVRAALGQAYYDSRYNWRFCSVWLWLMWRPVVVAV